MSYPFRTTYRQDIDTYIEDRGYAHPVKRGDADFATLDAEFGSILSAGQTAKRENGGEGWEVIDGFPLLEEAKAAKLEELKALWLNAEATGTIDSSVGFAIDATERANRNIKGLIDLLEASDPTQTVQFCAADNSFHEVNLEQLKTMRLEVIQYGQSLYKEKWILRQDIENADSVELLNAMTLVF